MTHRLTPIIMIDQSYDMTPGVTAIVGTVVTRGVGMSVIMTGESPEILSRLRRGGEFTITAQMCHNRVGSHPCRYSPGQRLVNQSGSTLRLVLDPTIPRGTVPSSGIMKKL